MAQILSTWFVHAPKPLTASQWDKSPKNVSTVILSDVLFIISYFYFEQKINTGCLIVLWFFLNGEIR